MVLLGLLLRILGAGDVEVNPSLYYQNVLAVNGRKHVLTTEEPNLVNYANNAVPGFTFSALVSLMACSPVGLDLILLRIHQFRLT